MERATQPAAPRSDRGRRPRRAAPLTIVVGGLGAVGRMLRHELAADLGRVVVIDPRSGRRSADVTAPGTIERDLLAHAETVVLAVHENVALAALPRLAELISETALVVETLSVKKRFAIALDGSRGRFEVVGINPMFGPSLTLAGRAVAVVPYGPGAHAARFAGLLSGRGAQPVELSVEDHDRTVAGLQALPHVAILAFARALATCELDLARAISLAPPPARAMLALAARIAAGNPHVYSEIQAANPFAAGARAALREALVQVCEAGADPLALPALLQEVRSELGAAESELQRDAQLIVAELRPATSGQPVRSGSRELAEPLG